MVCSPKDVVLAVRLLVDNLLADSLVVDVLAVHLLVDSLVMDSLVVDVLAVHLLVDSLLGIPEVINLQVKQLRDSKLVSIAAAGKRLLVDSLKPVSLPTQLLALKLVLIIIRSNSLADSP